MLYKGISNIEILWELILILQVCDPMEAETVHSDPHNEANAEKLKLLEV